MSPETFLIQNEMELKRIENAIEYPVLVKPVYSADWRKDGVWEAVGGRKVILADTREALRAEYYKFKDLAPIVLVQRYIQGEDNDIFTFCSYCNKESKIVFWFNTHKVLQIPEKYGTGIIVKSTINRDILESSQRLLEKIHYTGISEIEYKRDSLIGKYYLIEVNTRMWDQHPLSKSWNIELPILVYENMTKGVLPVPASRFEEMTWIADDAYLEYWLVNRVWKGERNFLPHGRRRYAIWDIKDPLPLIVAIASLLIDLVRRVFRKLYSSSRRFGGRNIRSSSV